MHTPRRTHAFLITAFALFTLLNTANAQKAVPTRDEIPDQYKWNLADIYPTLDAWERDFIDARKMVDKLTASKVDSFSSPTELVNVLNLYWEARWTIDKLRVYAHQLSHQDMRVDSAQALAQRINDLAVTFGQATAWIEPTLLKLSNETLREWCRNDDDLRIYAHAIEDAIRQKEHTLSLREEELLAMAGALAQNPADTYGILKNAEMQWKTMRDENGEEITLSSGRFNKYIRSSNRQLRRDAFLGTMATFKQYEKSFASTLNGAVQRDNFYAKARGFNSALEASLFPDNLPISVYTNLIDTINANLPLLHRWAKLRQDTLGLDKLHVWDLYSPLAQGGDDEIEYDDAVQTIVSALRPLGPEYCEPMDRGFRSRWIDVYETQGKRPGGYSWGSYETHPYILLNYNRTADEMSTIAHEMGHSMHSFFSNANQPPMYARYSYFVAEVAAIFNELMLQDYQLNHAQSREEKLVLLNHQIDRLRATVFRQVMFSEFEHQAHQMAQHGQPLTADSLGKLYVDIFHKYWGPNLVRDEEHNPYWARIPHFYRGDYYVYRYATSYCAAAALAENVIGERPGALEAYLNFLKSGGSDYALEILRKAGVDMTTPAPIEATMRRFERMITEMESLLELETARE